MAGIALVVRKLEELRSDPMRIRSTLVLIAVLVTGVSARGTDDRTDPPPVAAPPIQETFQLQDGTQQEKGPITLNMRLIPSVVVGGTWKAQGPGPTLNGQTENIQPVGSNNPVCGAVKAIVAHPTNPDVIWLGGVNGGIWKTTNATAANPNWTPLSDQFSSLSIGAMEQDPTDASNQTLVVGIGRYSSLGRIGGARAGLLRTIDGGSTWLPIDGSGTLAGKNVSGVAPRGSTIVVSVDNADTFTFANIGIFRSIDGGISFPQISGDTSTGLPAGRAFDLAGDPSNTAILYTGIRDAGGSNGIYQSTDTGATWRRVSNATMNALVFDTNITGTVNIKIAVGLSNNVFVAIANGRTLAGIFRSGDGGVSWTAMDLPATSESGIAFGIHPGGQAGVHFSIAADPTNANVVYVGGDRQPAPGPDGIERTADDSWPNSIGANNYSGRLFRGDASVAPTGGAPSPQWTPLTHSGTASNSSPHADSRRMVLDANGDMLEGDDGGIYRRTSPQNNTGDWFSVIGDLQVTEFHDIAYDTNLDIIIGGAQDNGTPQQITTGGATWNSVSQADGGDVAVDVLTLAGAGQSVRYSSFQNLGGFSRQVFNAGNVQVGATVSLIPSGGLAGFNPQFVTPIAVNAIAPPAGQSTRLVIGGGAGGANPVYESTNAGIAANTASVVWTNVPTGAGFAGVNAVLSSVPGTGIVNDGGALGYGGTSAGVANPDVLYVGSGPRVFLRTTAGGTLTATTALPAGGGRIIDIVLDPDEWKSAYVIDGDQVFRTPDAGVTWNDITGNLATITRGFRTIEYVEAPINDRLVVGTEMGVFVSIGPSFNSWFGFGSDLPNAPVFDLDYDPADDLLTAGTLGRGAWTLEGVSTIAPIDGACCDVLAASCRDSITEADCFPNQFTPGVLCAALSPPCTPAPGSDARMIILLDRTGSMEQVRITGKTRCEEALDQAKRDVQAFLRFPQNRKVAVWTVTSRVPCASHPVPAGEALIIDLVADAGLGAGFVDEGPALDALATLDGVPCGGCTPLAQAICEMADELSAVVPPLDSRDAILAISSDGAENLSRGVCAGVPEGNSSVIGPPPSGNYEDNTWQRAVWESLQGASVVHVRHWGAFALNAAANTASTADPETGGWGSRAGADVSDQVFFQDLAGSTGGRYRQVDDLDCLSEFDVDANGVLDLIDFEMLSECLRGPENVTSRPCVCFDADGNRRVDLLDFGGLQTRFGCVSGSPCNDGNACTLGDACSDNRCAPGALRPCDDGNPCTDDSCDSALGCVYVNNTASCNDGLFCNGADICSNGACTAHAGDPCPGPDGDGNCAESCNETADNCTANDANGSACNDGTFCNGTDTCSAGACSVHAGNPCPGPDGDGSCSESCSEASDNCTAPDPNGSACNDGVFCNGADTCQNGTCSGHGGSPCPGADGDGNCAESCNEAADNCTANDANGSACNDGTFCNGPDTCSNGACSGHAGDPCIGKPVCNNTCNEAQDSCFTPSGTPCTDDGNVCTNNLCDGSGTCVPNPNTAPCNDGLFCNGSDRCSNGTCSVHLQNACGFGCPCNEVEDRCGCNPCGPLGCVGVLCPCGWEP